MNESVVTLFSQEPVELLALAQAGIGRRRSPESMLWETTQEVHEDLAASVRAVLCAEASTLEAHHEDQWHLATCGQILLSVWKILHDTVTGLEDLTSWKKTKQE